MKLKSLFGFEMKSFKEKKLLVFLFCLLIGIALRFYGFDQKSLWLDEIHTFNQSRFALKDQFEFYIDHPTSLYPPFFFLLTHQFYPFTNPERDIRIIPLICGILCIPMIYLLSRLFSSYIALPCTLSFTFMAYQISLSQEGRSYSMTLFLGMTGLYFFIKYLSTLEKKYLLLAPLFFVLSIYTGYISIPYIVFSQLFWFYHFREEGKRPDLYSSFIFGGLLLVLCSPWFLFLALNYHGQSVMNPFEPQYTVSFWNILYGIFYDWTPHVPLMIISIALLVLLPLFLKDKINAVVLLLVFILPIGSFYLFCVLFNVTHFTTSRYFVNLLPVLLISFYMSLEAIDNKLGKLKNLIRLKSIFTILFIASNLLILPLYYQSGKQDFRGLANYLKGEIQDGDKIILSTMGHFSPLLHYFGIFPNGRSYSIPYSKTSKDEIEYTFPLTIDNKMFTIAYSNKRWLRFDLLEKNPGGGRLWLVVNKITAEKLKGYAPCVLKGYFDGSFLNFDKFPTDDSMYLFLWDPKSLDKKRLICP